MTSILVLGMVLLAAAAVQTTLAAAAAPEWGNLTASAILGWYAWHTAAKTVPSLVRHFREELAAFRSDQREERREFREALTAHRTSQQADHRMLAAALHELAERLR